MNKTITVVLIQIRRSINKKEIKIIVVIIMKPMKIVTPTKKEKISAETITSIKSHINKKMMDFRLWKQGE